MESMAEAIRVGTYAGLRVVRPYINMKKAAILRLGVQLRVDYADTWSCYEGGEIHCGECGTCVERREAFQVAGIADPTEYRATGPLPPKPGLN